MDSKIIELFSNQKMSEVIGNAGTILNFKCGHSMEWKSKTTFPQIGEYVSCLECNPKLAELSLNNEPK